MKDGTRARRRRGLLVTVLLGALVAPAGAWAAPEALETTDQIEVAVTVTGDGAPLSGATVTLHDATSVDSTSVEVDGVYTLHAPEGTYGLTVQPPPESPYDIFEEAVLEVISPGPVPVSVALVLSTDPDPDPPDPDPEEGIVSGRVLNAEGQAAAGVELQLRGSTTPDPAAGTTDSAGDYRIAAPPGTYTLRVTHNNSSPPPGWPRYAQVGFTEQLQVGDGTHLIHNVSLPFVAQDVLVRDPEGQPAVGHEVRTRVNESAQDATLAGEPATWSTDDRRLTDAEGQARLFVLPGPSDYISADGGALYPRVRIDDGRVLPTDEPVTLQFSGPITLSGRVLDGDGTPLRARIRLWTATSGVANAATGSDGTFELLRPTAPGPYRLYAEANEGTPSWYVWSDSFPLDENLDLGDIRLPRVVVSLCPTDPVSDGPLPVPSTVRTTSETQIDGTAGALNATYTFKALSNVGVSPETDCAELPLPDGPDADVRIAPDRNDEYMGTDHVVPTSPTSTRIELPVNRFDLLDDDVATDVGLQLVNGLGIPLDDVALDARGVTSAGWRYVVTDADGRVETRLLRERYDVFELRAGRTRPPTQRGFTGTSAGAPPAGRMDLDLHLQDTDPVALRHDLGTLVLPFTPVDVTVRGSQGQPLTSAGLVTPRVVSCSDGDDVLSETCTSSEYTTNGLGGPGHTNEYGRERLWLVPGSHQLTVTPQPSDRDADYQEQQLTVVVPPDSQGQSVFVALQNPSADPEPDPGPQIDVQGPYVVEPGGTVMLGAAVLAGSIDEVAWDLGGDDAFTAPGRAVEFDASGLSGPSEHPVAVRACDDQRRCATDATTVTVLPGEAPVPPEPPPGPDVHAGGPYSVAEGDVVEVEATVLPSDAEDIAWDLDGTDAFATPGAVVEFDATTLSGPSDHPVRVRACDDEARCAIATTMVTVTNLAPTVAQVSDPTVSDGVEVEVATTFTDPGVADVHTATFAWGDGSVAAGTIEPPSGAAKGTIAGSYAYPSCESVNPCEHAATLTVEDGTDSSAVDFVVTILPRIEEDPVPPTDPDGPPSPSDEDACKKGGWRELGDADARAFVNQGDCVSWFASDGRPPFHPPSNRKRTRRRRVPCCAGLA